MYKKAWCTGKVVVLLIKPIVFLTFPLPSASLDLKVPDAFPVTIPEVFVKIDSAQFSSPLESGEF